MSDLEALTPDEEILLTRVRWRFDARISNASSPMDWLNAYLQCEAAMHHALEDRRRLMRLAHEKWEQA